MVSLPANPTMGNVLTRHITEGGAFRSSNTGNVENRQWVVLVDTIICALTVAGASIILAHMMWRDLKGRGATVRTRLVQGLVTSDLLLGLVALIPSAENLRGIQHVAGSTFCDAFGVLLTSVIWMEHLWTLALAAATYLILIHPLSHMTRILEKRWPFLWLLIWAICFGQSIIGYEIYGFFPTGGICFYGSNSGLYGELMQFIPRAIVFGLVSFFYSHLFVFLRRPDKIRTSFSSSSPRGQDSSQNSSDPGRLRRGSAERAKRKLRAHFAKFSFRHEDRPVQKGQKQGEKMPGSLLDNQQTITIQPATPDLTTDPSADNPWDRNRNPSATGKSGQGMLPPIPPWERLELPAFAIPQEKNQHSSTGSTFRFPWTKSGKSSDTYTTTKTPITGGSSPGSIPMSKVSFDGTITATSSNKGRRASDIAHPFSQQSSVAVVDEVDPDQSSNRSRTSPLASPWGTVQEAFSRDSMIDHTRTEGFDAAPDLLYYPPPLVPSDTLTPSSSASFRTQSVATPLPPTWAAEVRRGSGANTESDLTGPTSFEGRNSSEKGERAEMNFGKEDGEMDFYHALRDLDGDVERADDRQFRLGSDETEVEPESTSSYLNRKTSLLMLYFPLAYCVLFSVSVVRLIYDFVHPNEPVALHALSRWFIFAQGLVDAVIYGLIEWRTKRVVRRKIKKGQLSGGGSKGSRGSANQSAVEALSGSRSDSGGQLMGTIRRGLAGSRAQMGSLQTERSTIGTASATSVQLHTGQTSA